MYVKMWAKVKDLRTGSHGSAIYYDDNEPQGPEKEEIHSLFQ
jgi:hypothetical protein